MVNFIENYDKFTTSRFGFRENRSTKLVLAQFVDKTVNALDSGEKVMRSFLHLSKAFDMVQYNILFLKLGIFKYESAC